MPFAHECHMFKYLDDLAQAVEPLLPRSAALLRLGHQPLHLDLLEGYLACVLRVLHIMWRGSRFERVPRLRLRARKRWAAAPDDFDDFG